MSRELKYSLVAGAVTLMWMTLGNLFQWHDKPIGKFAPLLSLFILTITIYFTILHKRDFDSGGAITFKEAFMAGFSVSFVIGLMVGAFLVIYSKYVNPGFVEELIRETTQQYADQKKSDLEIKRAVDSIRAMYTPFGQLTYGIGTTMITGALISLICALVMKKKLQPAG